jgi:hypothetical protein
VSAIVFDCSSHLLGVTLDGKMAGGSSANAPPGGGGLAFSKALFNRKKKNYLVAVLECYTRRGWSVGFGGASAEQFENLADRISRRQRPLSPLSDSLDADSSG